jgi:protein-L-isoaspartate(D-aspartate) O-methyltransferase
MIRPSRARLQWRVTNDRSDENQLSARRARMVEQDIRRRGIRDARVLDAMARVPRHRFVPPEFVREAYADYPVPIGEGQTISQPYIVALMTEALELEGEARVLEIGTGSGYQTAILAECGARVFTIERSGELARRARARFTQLGYERIHSVIGDGTRGLREFSPFDRILATGSLPRFPDVLREQLREGGIFVGPIGALYGQQLVRIVYDPRGMVEHDLGSCRFVPLIGAGGWADRSAGAASGLEQRHPKGEPSG